MGPWFSIPSPRLSQLLSHEVGVGLVVTKSGPDISVLQTRRRRPRYLPRRYRKAWQAKRDSRHACLPAIIPSRPKDTSRIEDSGSDAVAVSIPVVVSKVVPVRRILQDAGVGALGATTRETTSCRPLSPRESKLPARSLRLPPALQIDSSSFGQPDTDPRTFDQ